MGGWGYEANATSGDLAPSSAHLTRATFSRAVWECQRRGLRLCQQSCAGEGCGYDAFPVWTGIPCAPTDLDAASVEEAAATPAADGATVEGEH